MTERIEAQGNPAQMALSIGGRLLLALYFLVPGISKITNFDGTVQYMADHGMVAIAFFLILTIVLQLGGALFLAIGYRVQLTAFVLAGLVLVISLIMHDFWNVQDSVQQAHEMQNFIKNLAIMAGLMVLAGGPQAMTWSLLGRKAG
jgi:putative oxidoreductase